MEDVTQSPGHLSRESIEAALRDLPLPPADVGRVELLVARPESDARELPDCARLSPEGGLEGDRWSRRPSPNPHNQVTLIWSGYAHLVANGSPVELCGDNLIVDLDLSEDNLPPGARLRVGRALCEVTPLPHTGCGKFERRFGRPAREVTAAPEHAARRLRGIHVRVIEAGEVRRGDRIAVLSRPV